MPLASRKREQPSERMKRVGLLMTSPGPMARAGLASRLSCPGGSTPAGPAVLQMLRGWAQRAQPLDLSGSFGRGLGLLEGLPDSTREFSQVLQLLRCRWTHDSSSQATIFVCPALLGSPASEPSIPDPFRLNASQCSTRDPSWGIRRPHLRHGLRRSSPESYFRRHIFRTLIRSSWGHIPF